METNKLVQAFKDELNLTEQGFAELTEQKKGLVIDVTNEAGFKLARKERTEQNKILKNIDELAINGKRSVDEARYILKERVAEIYAPTVTVFETEYIRRKEEAKRLAQIEAERIQNMRDQINSIRQFSTNLFGKSSEELQGIIEAVDMIDVSENFAELTQEALTVKKEVLSELNKSVSTAIQNEQLAVERENLRKQQEEQNEKHRIIELKAKAQERLNNLMMIPTTMFGKTSKEVDSMILKVEHTPIIESQFGDLLNQANDSVKTVVKQLGAMLAQAKFMEEQQHKDNYTAQENLKKSNASAITNQEESILVDNQQAQKGGLSPETPTEQALPCAKDIELFLSKALSCDDELINDFGYLLICDDHQINCEAMSNLRNKFKLFVESE